MEVIINGTKYIIDITEDELFKFFEVNSVEVKLDPIYEMVGEHVDQYIINSKVVKLKLVEDK